MPPEIVLRPDLAAFLQGGVSVRLASRDGLLKPVVGRALAATVQEDRRRIRLVLASVANRGLLRAVRDSGVIAAAFTQPTTHRSIQIKGVDAVIGEATAEDAELVERQGRGFIVELRELSFPEPFVRAVEVYEPGPLAALVFTCAGIFDQTPGPGAGEAVAS